MTAPDPQGSGGDNSKDIRERLNLKPGGARSSSWVVPTVRSGYLEPPRC